MQNPIGLILHALGLLLTRMIGALPGFRSKTWLLGEQSGEFIGRYEIDTVEVQEADHRSRVVRTLLDLLVHRSSDCRAE